MDILGSVPWWVWFGILGGGGCAILAFVPGALALVIGVWNALPRPVKFVLGGVVVVIIAYLKGRNTGRDVAEDQQRARDARATQTRLDVETETGNLTEQQLDARLEKHFRD